MTIYRQDGFSFFHITLISRSGSTLLSGVTHGIRMGDTGTMKFTRCLAFLAVGYIRTRTRSDSRWKVLGRYDRNFPSGLVQLAVLAV